MDIDFINTIIKIFFIEIFSLIICMKLINNNGVRWYRKIIIIIMSATITLIYFIIKKYADLIVAVCILYFFTSITIKYITHNKIGNSMLLALVSLSMCFLSFIISVSIEYIPFRILRLRNNCFNLIIIILMQYFIINNFFKIKRFKNGLSFLQNACKNDFIDLIMINISSIIIFVYCLLGSYYGNLTRHILMLFFLLGFIMIVTIRKIMSLFYKQKLLYNTIEEYKKEIKEKNEEINKLSEEKFSISKLNHEFYNRQQALELKVKEMTLEAGEEIGVLDRIKSLTSEYSENLEKIKGKSKLPLTDIPEIDDMFKYMQTECYNNNIDFKLQIEENIYQLVNNIIPKNKLETLIGDHIKDAIIAVNSSDNKYKSILVILGIKDNCYELCIYDSGIEFEIETLLKLGLESITTHKEDGGTGIGFITTFETLKECKASLIIEERHEIKDNDYTKAVIFRFDNKNEYKIYSYRADEIRKCSNNSRIIIENLP